MADPSGHTREEDWGSSDDSGAVPVDPQDWGDSNDAPMPNAQPQLKDEALVVIRMESTRVLNWPPSDDPPAR